MAAVAELEAGLISQRTRAALSVAKARGVKLGNPQLKAGTADCAKAAAAASSAQAKARAADVCRVLDISNSRDAASRLDIEDKSTLGIADTDDFNGLGAGAQRDPFPQK